MNDTEIISLVRNNLLTVPGYTPYCGEWRCPNNWPRTKFNGSQFECSCGWHSKFKPEFIEKYKQVSK